MSVTEFQPGMATVLRDRDAGADAPLPLAKSSKSRDARLDFLRGLCLIDMILVHLSFAGLQMGVLNLAIAEYTRFAAGGFVFVAGLCIGAIFLPRMKEASKRKKTFGTLWRRSAYILGAHYAASAGLVAVYAWLDYTPIVDGVGAMLLDLLLLRQGGDLLPLYVIMVAVSPLLLMLIHRRMGLLVLVASVAVFAWGQDHPWILSTTEKGSFPIVLWQLMYVLGMLTGTQLHKLDAVSRRGQMILAAIAWASCGLMFYLAYGAGLGLAVPKVPLEFRKIPLSTGEVLRYLSIISAIVFTTMLLWRWIDNTRVERFVGLLGRNSLWLYVAHLFIHELVMLVAWKLNWLGTWQTFLAIAAVALAWVVAVMLEMPRKPISFRWLGGWGAVPSGAATAVVLLMIGSVHSPPPAVVPDDPTMSAMVEDADDIVKDGAIEEAETEQVVPQENDVDQQLFG